MRTNIDERIRRSAESWCAMARISELEKLAQSNPGRAMLGFVRFAIGWREAYRDYLLERFGVLCEFSEGRVVRPELRPKNGEARLSYGRAVSSSPFWVIPLSVAGRG